MAKTKKDLRILPLKFLITEEEQKQLQQRAAASEKVLGQQSPQSFARWMALHAPLPTDVVSDKGKAK